MNRSLFDVDCRSCSVFEVLRYDSKSMGLFYRSLFSHIWVSFDV